MCVLVRACARVCVEGGEGRRNGGVTDEGIDAHAFFPPFFLDETGSSTAGFFKKPGLNSRPVRWVVGETVWGLEFYRGFYTWVEPRNPERKLGHTMISPTTPGILPRLNNLGR